MPALRYRKNILSLRRDIDARRLANRAIPQGASEDGSFWTMADHAWRIAGISGREVAIEPDRDGPAIYYPSQLDRLLARKVGTTAQWEVESTDEQAQSVTLIDVPDTLQVGNYLRFRANPPCLPGGADLVYLDNPASIAKYGVFSDVVPRPDIPPIDNLVAYYASPYFDEPSGTMPTGWHVTTGATAQPHVDREFFRFGRGGVRVQCAAGFTAWPPEGIVSDWIDVFPTVERPYFSFQFAFEIALGRVSVFVEVDTDGSQPASPNASAYGSTIVIPDPAEALNPIFGLPISANRFTSLRTPTEAGILGINLWDDPNIGQARRVRLWITKFALFDSAIFYVDAAQVTQTHGGFPTFYDGISSNRLWHAALEHLAGYPAGGSTRVGGWSEPRYHLHVEPHDLFKQDPTTYAFEQLRQGSTVPVHDSELGVNLETRVESIRSDRSRLRAGVTELELSTRAEQLTRQLGRNTRPRNALPVNPLQGEIATAGTGPGLSSPRVRLIRDMDNDGKDWELLEWDHNAAIGSATVDISSTLGGALVSGRDPSLEWDGTDSLALFGSYRTEVTALLGTKGVDPRRVNVYTIQLIDGGVIATYQTSRTDYYVP